MPKRQAPLMLRRADLASAGFVIPTANSHRRNQLVAFRAVDHLYQMAVEDDPAVAWTQNDASASTFGHLGTNDFDDVGIAAGIADKFPRHRYFRLFIDRVLAEAARRLAPTAPAMLHGSTLPFALRLYGLRRLTRDAPGDLAQALALASVIERIEAVGRPRPWPHMNFPTTDVLVTGVGEILAEYIDINGLDAAARAAAGWETELSSARKPAVDGMSVADWLCAYWQVINPEASGLGTLMHDRLECVVAKGDALTGDELVRPEFIQATKWRADVLDPGHRVGDPEICDARVRVWQAEWVVHSSPVYAPVDAPRANICGTIDLVCVYEEQPDWPEVLHIQLRDYKRAKEMVHPGTSRFSNSCTGPRRGTDFQEDCNVLNYTFNMCCYRFLLETYYRDVEYDGRSYTRMVVREAYLDVFHPAQDAKQPVKGNYQIVRLNLAAAMPVFRQMFAEFV